MQMKILSNQINVARPSIGMGPDGKPMIILNQPDLNVPPPAKHSRFDLGVHPTQLKSTGEEFHEKFCYKFTPPK